MAYKSANVGLFTIPTAPSIGTSATSGAANVYTTTYVQLIASTASAQYITAINIATVTATTVPAYCNVQLATGAAGAETIIGQIQLSPNSATTTTAVKTAHVPIFPWIPVATATRIAFKVADNLGTIAWTVSITCIAATNVVVDGNVKEQADVQTWLATAVTAATAGVPDTNTKNINNVAAATPGASGGVLISGSNSGTTTLAALTVTGVTTHTGNVLLSAGLTVNQSTANTSALILTGNGTGHGMLATSGTGATGNGAQFSAASTNGSGLTLVKTGTGSDLNATVTPLVLAKTTNLTGLNDIAATAIVSSGAITTASGKVSLVGTVDTLTTYTNNTVQTGDSFARIGAAGANLTAVTGVTLAANQHVIVDSGTVTTVTNQLTAAAISTQVWTDTTASDFTAALSVGKSVMNGVALGTGLTVASVSGAVGSVTGAVGSVTGAVGSVTGLTAANLDTTISSRMATYTQPTGFLAATFPTGTVANTTNITAGVITTVTNLTNAPLDSSGVTTLLTRVPAAISISSGIVSADIKKVNALSVKGDGTGGNPWGPV